MYVPSATNLKDLPLTLGLQIAFLSYVFFDIAFGTEIQIHGLEDVYWLTFMVR